MKKKYILFSVIFFVIVSTIVLTLKKNDFRTFTKLKTLIPKDLKIFIKERSCDYLYYTDINLSFVREYSIKSKQKKNFLIKEYNNKLLNLQGPRAYLGSNEDNIFLATRNGLLSYSNINNFIDKENFKLKNIKTNIKNIINYTEFFTDNTYGIKGMMIDNDYIYLSLSNEISNDCWAISVIKADLNLDNLIFSYIFKHNQCVKRENKYGEFQAIQSGGVMSDFDSENFLLTTGDFRFRDLAQDDKSIFGKILLVNKKSGKIKIISKGHRNAQGIYFDKKKKIISSTEHGPFGGDEININKNIDDYKNFGWPISSYGEHYPSVPKEVYEKARF